MLEKFEKHIGKPVKVKIGKDEFELKPLTLAQVKDCMVAATILSKPNLTKKEYDEAFNMYIQVLKDVVKASYPELSDKMVESFVANNIATLLNALPELAGLPNPTKEAEQLFKK